MMQNKTNKVSLVWFRHDLRVWDNPALSAAAELGQPVLCVYVDPKTVANDAWARGGATNVVLASALEHLDSELKKLGTHLHVLSLQREEDLVKFCVKEHVTHVFWNRRYDRHGIAIDTEVKKNLGDSGIQVQSFKASVLLEPFEVKQSEGKPYQVYTPFSKFYERELRLEPLAPTPAKLVSARNQEADETVENFVPSLYPKISWHKQMQKMWVMSEARAHENLTKFLKTSGSAYKERRDYPADDGGTSKLSPYLALGIISPRQIFWEIAKSQDGIFSKDPGVYHFQKEVMWREFAQHLIYHFPQTDREPLRDSFRSFPWEDNAIHLELWQRGQTGYPIIDAAMRELWATGWMHNRARMIVASFLVKHLRLNWLHGAKWFWDTLVDAELANNTLGWQWSAGCGADAAPYFRIFNPVLQGEKFDAEGAYVRKWVPELQKVPSKWIHKPWEAPTEVMVAAGVKLGQQYPAPMVDHNEEREKALRAFKQISGKV